MKRIYLSQKFYILCILVLIAGLLYILNGLYSYIPQTAAQVGQQCSLVQANCTWDALDGATSYKITVTELETNTVIKTDTIQAPTTKYVFPVTQGKTYRCDVAAVNSCGAAGVAGTAQALCEVNGIVSSPSPTTSVSPAPTAPPVFAACGAGCTATSDCQAGLVCVVTGSGAGYCAQQALQQACGTNPSVARCCVPPTQAPQPTVAPTGETDHTVITGLGISSLIAMGAFLLWKSLV